MKLKKNPSLLFKNLKKQGSLHVINKDFSRKAYDFSGVIYSTIEKTYHKTCTKIYRADVSYDSLECDQKKIERRFEDENFKKDKPFDFKISENLKVERWVYEGGKSVFQLDKAMKKIAKELDFKWVGMILLDPSDYSEVAPCGRPEETEPRIIQVDGQLIGRGDLPKFEKDAGIMKLENRSLGFSENEDRIVRYEIPADIYDGIMELLEEK